MAQLDSKLKRGDDVVVISGKSKGQSGKIARVITATNRVVVEGVNMVKKHLSQKDAMRLGREPGVVQKEASIHVSNVMLKDPKTGAPTRVGYKVNDDGSKVRVAKKSGTELDTVKKANGAAKKSAKPTKAKSK